MNVNMRVSTDLPNSIISKLDKIATEKYNKKRQRYRIIKTAVIEYLNKEAKD